MKLISLASSSYGNCYLLKFADKTAMIECGLKWTKTKKLLWDLNEHLLNLAFVFVSHEHRDHSRAISQITQRSLPILTSRGTKLALQIDRWNIFALEPHVLFKKPYAKIVPIKLIHDAIEPIGFVMDCEEGRFVYITDTMYVPYCFKNLNYLLIECNYIEELLIKSELPLKTKKRVLKTHLSLERLILFLERQKERHGIDSLKHVWICHLSNARSNEQMIYDKVKSIVNCPVSILPEKMELYDG